MPVPVPKKQPAHPVLKSSHRNSLQNGQHLSVQNLKTSLPVSPVGLPPSFGTREEWINSLPSWRRSKPRPIWEDEVSPHNRNFAQIQGCYSVSKVPSSARTQTNLSVFPELSATIDISADADYKMSAGSFTGAAKWMDVDHPSTVLLSLDLLNYERGAFTPVFEDLSPVQNKGDVPNGSQHGTPFGEFVDRAVSATSVLPATQEGNIQQMPHHDSPAKPLKDTAPSQDVVTPTATAGYKKLAEPLSEWVANFVWRACTAPGVTTTAPYRQFPAVPPSHLAVSVHSLLLSTLLQPSAVLLALWYIARLPISFHTVALGPEQHKEFQFRALLLGDEQLIETKDAHVPFRLVVLGCMLANKWLDDHTFSNKTWHSISNVPIRLLNQLESFVLGIFGYDLSVSSADWSQWLLQLKSHHTTNLSPLNFPQPISRPSASPQAIVRKAIEEIIQTQKACTFPPSQPQPIFLGVEERRKEKMEWEKATQVVENTLSDIDLDENGPLRDEYLPKKRQSLNHSSNRLAGNGTRTEFQDENASVRKVSQANLEKMLPPPAAWSPAGDEPILRDRNRVNGPYMAVQPPAAAIPVQFQLVSYQPHQELYGWPVPPPPHMSMGYLFDLHVQAPIFQAMAAPPPPSLYAHCEVMVPITHSAPSHSRSQSLSGYDQTSEVHQHRMRSYSQSFNYLSPEFGSNQAPWAGHDPYDLPYAQLIPPLPSYCGVGGYQAQWVRA